MSQVYLAEHRGSSNWGDRKSNQNKSNQMSLFGESGKPEYLPWKNLSEQSGEPTNSTHNRTRAKLVEGQCSHHCANTAPKERQQLWNLIHREHNQETTNLSTRFVGWIYLAMSRLCNLVLRIPCEQGYIFILSGDSHGERLSLQLSVKNTTSSNAIMDRLPLKKPRKTTYGKIREQYIRKTETKNAIKSTVGQAKEAHLSGREIRFKIEYI